MDVVEKAMAYAPPITYSHVTGIRLADRRRGRGLADHRRRHAEGADGPQPGVHLRPAAGRRRDRPQAGRPADGARRVHEGRRRRRGDRGQAGTPADHDRATATARRRPCGPPTRPSTGSGSPSATTHGRIRGRAMVVGATGAIGSVCARLLALASDELWLISPESAKLLALKHEIERENPRADVHIAATPDEHLPDMDLIVTATSGAGKRVLDIMDRQARVRDHRRRPPAGPVRRGRRQAARRPGDRVRRDRAARATCG